MQALYGYALLLTERPWGVTERDLEVLKAAGFSAREIIDANQVISYFNYINRVASGLGVQLEAESAHEHDPRAGE